ncbi:MAG: hypothetical protein GXP14_16375 [Gammaproteobacteria bacterium]|nr:hypothetical protein [Gammaproteobacteria bacterium]
MDITELPPLPIKQDQAVSDVDSLVRFTFKLSDIPIPELQNMAHQAIIEFACISQNGFVLSSELKTQLSQVGMPQVKALSVLNGIVGECADFVTTFKSEITTLSISNDLCVRLMARKLASNLSIDVAPVPDDRQKLPFIYEIELPELDNKKEAIPYSALSPGGTLPDMGDPLEMIRPLSAEAELIAKMSNVPLQNVVTRALDLMQTLVPEEQWNKAAEEELREWMKGIDLELAYRRQRPQIAKLALSHVACELLDAGQISLINAHFLESIFMRSDSYMLPVKPIERPDYIDVPDAKDRDLLHHNNEWLDTISESLLLFRTSYNNDQIILGELTKWCWLGWEKPTETRLSMVCHNEWPNWGTPHYASSFFPHKMCWAAKDYPNIEGIREPSLVIYGSPAYVDLGGTKWLALNPAIGFSLGWSISSDGLFRWVDSSGELMVESIFWKDGPVGRQPPKMDDVCSDGWLVVATLKAVDAIRQLTGEAIKIDAVIRSHGKNPYALEVETIENRNQWALINGTRLD